VKFCPPRNIANGVEGETRDMVGSELGWACVLDGNANAPRLKIISIPTIRNRNTCGFHSTKRFDETMVLFQMV